LFQEADEHVQLPGANDVPGIPGSKAQDGVTEIMFLMLALYLLMVVSIGAAIFVILVYGRR